MSYFKVGQLISPSEPMPIRTDEDNPKKSTQLGPGQIVMITSITRERSTLKPHPWIYTLHFLWNGQIWRPLQLASGYILKFQWVQW